MNMNNSAAPVPVAVQFSMHAWQRFFVQDTPIYISGADPHWFVPNRAGDELLKQLQQGVSPDGNISTRKFLARLPGAGSTSTGYIGRSSVLRLDKLRELWFHLTNRCNMSCSHCLFSSSDSDRSELPAESVFARAAEAYRDGCRLFVLTGGEPLVHPRIDEIVAYLLSLKNAHVVMLTNGNTLVPFLERCRPDPSFFHLQLSMDGISATHDRVRGSGSFRLLEKALRWLHNNSTPCTLSFCATAQNVHELPSAVEFAASLGVSNLHLLWYFVRGRAARKGFVDIDTLFDQITQAALAAEKHRLPIDNLQALKTQFFAPPGTIHDGTTAGWESLAMGPDGLLYPSAALVGIAELATEIHAGLGSAWRHSPVLQRVRQETAASLQSPFRFFLGGGDLDHSYLTGREFMGCDPYQTLHERLALWLISREVPEQPTGDKPALRLQMGDLVESCGAHGGIAFIHSNCLIAAAQRDALTMVKEFYTDAVGDAKQDILNPVCYEPALVDHIPEEYRFRGYGCGSPVIDAGIEKSESMVDLGCGSGVECFIASRLAGASGSVIGIDMLDTMLDLANRALPEVEKRLGYRNIEFRKGYLEQLPVESDTVDLVLSNCVMNLSVNKRRAYAEIFRVLRPGGRLVISDVVCESEPGAGIRNDEQLRGECIAGALTESHLMGLLEESGFINVTLLKRFPYRTVNGHPFYALTYRAMKPMGSEKVRVIYRGPLPHVMTDYGTLLMRGIPSFIERGEADVLDGQVFVLSGNGAVVNASFENTCACVLPPQEAKSAPPASALSGSLSIKRRPKGCMICGKPLQYSSIEYQHNCIYCGLVFRASSCCEAGHYVCDTCHAADALSVIRQVCLTSAETDMVRLFADIKRHPTMPVHGPEYHALVPGIILATYKNLGGVLPEGSIETGISRGSGIAGGFCGFMGVCGATVGVGIAFSILLEATPLKPKQRQAVMSVTQSVMQEIARYEAARCCQRDVVLALRTASALSAALLPLELKAGNELVCSQKHLNRECAGKACPLHS